METYLEVLVNGGNAEGNKTALISMKRRSKKIRRAGSTKVQPAVSVVCGQRRLRERERERDREREREINERGN